MDIAIVAFEMETNGNVPLNFIVKTVGGGGGGLIREVDLYARFYGT